VFDVTGRRKDLREFLLGLAGRLAVMAEQDRPAAGGSLIERENMHGGRR
jgi:hypothetical protein